MIIEFAKKKLLKVVGGIIVAIGLVYIGYNIGFDNGYDRATSNYEHKKGDGTNFYAEEKTGTRANLLGKNLTHDYIMYHSIPDCNAIENGVSKNRAYSDSTYRMNNSVFCPKCMNDYLIELCETFLQGDLGK